ncbi:MAG TPA: ATP-binding protein [bacterium]|nr:cyclic nucleotide-binding domain-containing protein [Candidatus Omnitrophota bacterium]HOL93364.1 ATP-binding protein [bacterium]HXK94126.1 ATP-binding protein [bacterium]
MNRPNPSRSYTVPANLPWLIETYFSNPAKRLRLKKGDVLMRQGEYNDRLYLIISGTLCGYIQNPDGSQSETFRSTKNLFVGGPSYFSKLYTAFTTVIAAEDSEVAYIDPNQEPVFDGQTASLAEQFMPVLVIELIHRQHRIQTIAFEKEKTLRALIHSEKMASLGKIAAGIAHELNNAVAVLIRNSEWLSQTIAKRLRRQDPAYYEYFATGLDKGRCVSSAEARAHAQQLKTAFPIREELAAKIAHTGISAERVERLADKDPAEIEKILDFWEIGATLNDMIIAARHAAHVVRSIKDLGAQQPERQPGLLLNDCLREALTLLASPLRVVAVELDLAPLPAITGNRGEFVQMFINLIQNACESMAAARSPNPTVRIRSLIQDDEIQIQIEDNGPGIPPDVLPRIFEPTLTTKSDRRSVGLGLGLTIVERLIHSYGGHTTVTSRPGQTVFTLHIPRGNDHGKASNSHRG